MRYAINAHEIEAYSLDRLQKNASISCSYQTTSVALEEQGRAKVRELMQKDGSEVEAERASVPQLQRFQKKITLHFAMDLKWIQAYGRFIALYSSLPPS